MISRFKYQCPYDVSMKNRLIYLETIFSPHKGYLSVIFTKASEMF